MRSFEEAFEAAADEPAFSNGTEGYAWLENWCGRCIHDKPSRQGHDDKGCPLILVSLLQRTPSEWVAQDQHYLGDTFHCIEFRDEKNGPNAEPRPLPDPPGQELLLPREPYTAMRMLSIEPALINEGTQAS